MQWLAARGHVMNSEEHQVLSRLKVLLPKWEKALQPLGHQNATSLLGYIRELDGERQWLIDKKQFLRQLDIPGQYMREVMPMLQRGWLATNEPERATLKLMIKVSPIVFSHCGLNASMPEYRSWNLMTNFPVSAPFNLRRKT